MAGKKKQTFVWWVEHPDHTVAVVVADNWEQATVEAAKWWDVPWGKVAALCEEQKKEPLTWGTCRECGAKMWGEGKRARCAVCDAKAKDREIHRRKFLAQVNARKQRDQGGYEDDDR